MDELHAIPVFEDGEITKYARLADHTSSYMERVRQEALAMSESMCRGLLEVQTRLDGQCAQKRRELDRRETELAKRELELQNATATFDDKARKHYGQARDKGQTDGFKQGYAEGQSRGFDEGKKHAEQEANERIAREVENRLSEQGRGLRPALDRVVREMCGMRQAMLKQWEENVLQIAAALAYRTIGRELPNMPDLPVELLRETLELCLGSTELKIRMNPDDLESLRPTVEQLLAETGTLGKSEVVADPKVSPGGCVVETAQGVVDQRLETRLERIIAELGQ